MRFAKILCSFALLASITACELATGPDLPTQQWPEPQPDLSSWQDYTWNTLFAKIVTVPIDLCKALPEGRSENVGRIQVNGKVTGCAPGWVRGRDGATRGCKEFGYSTELNDQVKVDCSHFQFTIKSYSVNEGKNVDGPEVGRVDTDCNVYVKPIGAGDLPIAGYKVTVYTPRESNHGYVHHGPTTYACK